MATKRILVLCTGNSARSQMAEGFLRSLDSGLEVHSAGTHPSPRVNPYAIRAMQEVGIDISNGEPKSVERFLDRRFDYVFTVCDDADHNCPHFRGTVGKRVHMGFVDPARATGSEEEILGAFRRVRDEIRTQFMEYYQKEIRSEL
ncbi:MAG: arsenate reductase ArsC [Bryobacteraceae bacterium]